MYTNIYGSIMHNSPKVKTTINARMDKENWHIPPLEYCQAVKTNDVLIHGYLSQASLSGSEIVRVKDLKQIKISIIINLC